MHFLYCTLELTSWSGLICVRARARVCVCVYQTLWRVSLTYDTPAIEPWVNLPFQPLEGAELLDPSDSVVDLAYLNDLESVCVASAHGKLMLVNSSTLQVICAVASKSSLVRLRLTPRTHSV